MPGKGEFDYRIVVDMADELVPNYTIRLVFYDADGKPESAICDYSIPPTGATLGELTENMIAYSEAMSKPVLKYSDLQKEKDMETTGITMLTPEELLAAVQKAHKSEHYAVIDDGVVWQNPNDKDESIEITAVGDDAYCVEVEKLGDVSVCSGNMCYSSTDEAVNTFVEKVKKSEAPA